MFSAYVKCLAATIALVAAALLTGQAAAHACSYGDRPEDACLVPVAGPPGTDVTLLVQGSAATATEICVVWNDRRMTGILAGVIEAIFAPETCPEPLPAAKAEPARVCLADFSRGGRNVCRLREPQDPEVLLARFPVSEEDRVPRMHSLFFERAVRFHVPEVDPGVYLVSWLDCPPGDCAHLVFASFRVTAPPASSGPGPEKTPGIPGNAASDSELVSWPVATIGVAAAAAFLALAVIGTRLRRGRTRGR